MPWMRLITIIISLALAACSTSMPRPDTATAEPPIGIEPIDLATLPDRLLPAEPAAVPAPQQEPAVPEYADIWSRIRDNMHLQRHTDKYSVKSRLNWYIRHPEYLDRVADRATPYLYYITQQLDKRNMPLELALLPVVESAYQPFAYSPSHASGLWQFIPGTGRLYGLKQNWWYDGRRDIIAATQAALDYLQKLHDDFDGNWLLALAAYNSGERNVVRAIRRNKRSGKSTDFWSLHLPRETRGYVPSLLAVAELVSSPDQYNVDLKPIPNQPYFAKVDVDGQLDLALAAQMSGLSMDDLYTLNPGFNRWATDPSGPHYLLLPFDKRNDFEKQLAGLPAEKRVNWQRHVIKRGESLSEIADHYHTSIKTIRQVNNIRGHFIRTGHSLLIPSSKMPLKHYSLSLDNRRYRGLKRIGSGEKYLYTVRSGDTLWDIGRQYGVSIRSLCAWNGISSRRYLRPGQKLTLWLDKNDHSADNSDDSSKVEVAEHTADGSGAINYTVKSGDSLWLISHRFGVTVAQLVKWNDISPRR
jgi:membrane-bound lytic murein transglycosylase D